MEWMKAIVAPLIVSAIVGLVTFYFGRATAPDLPLVEAEIRSIDLRNPIRKLPSGGIAQLDKFVQDNFKMSGAGNIARSLDYESSIRFAILTLKNNSKVRTKEIEINGDRKVGMMAVSGKSTQTELSSQMKIGPLDPTESATVYIFADAWSKYSPAPIRVLHDDRLIEVDSFDLSSDAGVLAKTLSQYSVLIPAMIMSGIFTIFLVLFVIPLAILSNVSMAFRAKVTSKQELKKLSAFIDYMKQNHPRKFED